MQALVFLGPGKAVVRDWQPPALGPHDVRVDVAACGVCGTDRHIVSGEYPAAAPNVLGHEFSGIVGEVGSAVDRLRPGDLVAIDPNIADGECAACRRGDVHLCERMQAVGVTRPGGMAPHAVVPSTQAYKIPDGLSLDAAAFAEPLSCVVHGLERVRPPLGFRALVLGAGSIGLLMLQALRAIGAGRVVVSEPSAPKRALASSLGADAALEPAELADPWHRDAYDLVVDCTGAPPLLKTAVDAARRGGDVLLFGVAPKGRATEIEPYELYRKELRIVASNVNPHTMGKALALLGSGVVRTSGIVSHRVALEQLPDVLLSPPAPDEIKAAVYFG